jgi:hypothetical protein
MYWQMVHACVQAFILLGNKAAKQDPQGEQSAFEMQERRLLAMERLAARDYHNAKETRMTECLPNFAMFGGFLCQRRESLFCRNMRPTTKISTRPNEKCRNQDETA